LAVAVFTGNCTGDFEQAVSNNRRPRVVARLLPSLVVGLVATTIPHLRPIIDNPSFRDPAAFQPLPPKYWLLTKAIKRK
jgi:hypothetical protein